MNRGKCPLPRRPDGDWDFEPLTRVSTEGVPHVGNHGSIDMDELFLNIEVQTAAFQTNVMEVEDDPFLTTSAPKVDPPLPPTPQVMAHLPPPSGLEANPPSMPNVSEERPQA